MLAPGGRRARAIFAVLLVVCAVGGAVAGQDDHFPFAPFRMFSTRTEPQGEVHVAQLRGAVVGSQQDVALSMASFGLRRAEVEGQLDRLRSPRMLGELVRSREAVRRDLPKLERLRLVQVHYVLRDGKQVGRRETTVAEWHR